MWKEILSSPDQNYIQSEVRRPTNYNEPGRPIKRWAKAQGILSLINW